LFLVRKMFLQDSWCWPGSGQHPGRGYWPPASWSGGISTGLCSRSPFTHSPLTDPRPRDASACSTRRKCGARCLAGAGGWGVGGNAKPPGRRSHDGCFKGRFLGRPCVINPADRQRFPAGNRSLSSVWWRSRAFGLPQLYRHGGTASTVRFLFWRRHRHDC